MKMSLPIRTISYSSLSLLLLTPVLMVFSSACSKKTPVVPPPPPPPTQAGGPTTPGAPGRVTINEFVAEPSSVERGQSAILRWTVTNATGVSIDHGIGTVPFNGTQRLPAATVTTTYVMTATGAGGDATARATLTVTAPVPPPPPANTSSPRGTIESRVSDLRDALFDYDSNNIREDARAALTADAEALKGIFADFPRAVIIVEGHCDERGSAEYNLGLGDRRSSAARDFLTQLGIPADRMKTVSYGKERPTCTEATESCWQRNRRAHFSVGQ